MAAVAGRPYLPLMDDPARPFDRRLLRLRRARAARALRNGSFLHEEIAVRLLDRLDDIRRPLGRVLDLGSGCPRLVQALRTREGTDFLLRQDGALALLAGDGPAVVADEELLPFGADRFDAVFGIMSLHKVNDLPGTLVQIRHCLKPDGLLLAAFPGGGTLGELREALLLAELECLGGATPRVGPFVDLADAAALLMRAGFALPVADRDTITVHYRDPLHLLADLRAMGETAILAPQLRRPLRREALARALELYRRRFAADRGRVRATFEILFLIGWKPHPDQPRPLPRGSGEVDLAAHLGRPPGGAQCSRTSGSPGGSKRAANSAQPSSPGARITLRNSK